MGDIRVEVALSLRAEHAEGPLWDAATSRLLWVDITGQRVHCFDPASGNDTSWATAGQPGRPGVTGPPAPRYAGVPPPPAHLPERDPGPPRPEKGGTP